MSTNHHFAICRQSIYRLSIYRLSTFIPRQTILWKSIIFLHINLDLSYCQWHWKYLGVGIDTSFYCIIDKMWWELAVIGLDMTTPYVVELNMLISTRQRVTRRTILTFDIIIFLDDMPVNVCWYFLMICARMGVTRRTILIPVNGVLFVHDIS